jgi:gentisate 1,2-dioxygenase
MGALLGDDVVYAEAGDLAFKPRDQWHTFWNAGDEPCRILEVISPGGFEHFFREFDETTRDGSFDPVELGRRYDIEFDMESVPRLCAEHGLVHPLLAMLDAGDGPSGV